MIAGNLVQTQYHLTQFFGAKKNAQTWLRIRVWHDTTFLRFVFAYSKQHSPYESSMANLNPSLDYVCEQNWKSYHFFGSPPFRALHDQIFCTWHMGPILSKWKYPMYATTINTTQGFWICYQIWQRTRNAKVINFWWKLPIAVVHFQQSDGSPQTRLWLDHFHIFWVCL